VIQVLVENVSLPGKSQTSLVRIDIPGQGRIPQERTKPAEAGKKPSGLSPLAEALTAQQNEVKGIRNVKLNFSVDRASNEVVVTVVDDDTGKVIRQIPAKEALDLAAKIEEVTGLIFDKQA
jgi:flagellar protein FlaG